MGQRLGKPGWHAKWRLVGRMQANKPQFRARAHANIASYHPGPRKMLLAWLPQNTHSHPSLMLGTTDVTEIDFFFKSVNFYYSSEVRLSTRIDSFLVLGVPKSPVSWGVAS